MYKDSIEKAQASLPSSYDRLIDELTEKIIEKLKASGVLDSLSHSYKTAPESTEVDLISVEQTLNITNPPIGRTTLFYWTKSGKVTAYKVGKRVFYSKKAITSFLTSVVKKPPRL